MTMKVSCIQKTFSPPTKILEIPPAMVVFVEAYLYPFLLKPAYMQNI